MLPGLGGKIAGKLADSGIHICRELMEKSMVCREERKGEGDEVRVWGEGDRG